MNDDEAIQVKRSGKWVDATLVERQPSGRVIVRVDGKRRGFDACDVREVRAARVPTVRAVEPDDEEGPMVRSAGMVRTPIVELPKPHTPRSTSHLAFVRTRACAWCGVKGRTEASHHGIHGTGIKASDYRAIALCVECHRHHGDHFTLPKSAMNPDQTREWFKDRALDVCADRLEEGRKR